MQFFDECVSAINNIDSSDYDKYRDAYDRTNNFILLGNGGSNAAAAHIAQDMTKRGGKRAIAFTDPSMLTCFINDYGIEFAYTRFLEFYAMPDSMVILISSSGMSKNIVNSVTWCEENSVNYGILTAFDRNNRMRAAAKNAEFDLYIDTQSYGVAECVHQIFLHGVVECDQ